MSPDRLAALREFFAGVEPRLPQLVAGMFSRLQETIPEVQHLFKGGREEAQARYLHMLQTIVQLTRSRHLWPVQALTGTASIPPLDKLADFHAGIGIPPEYFAKINAALVQCFKEDSPDDFTPEVEEALGFIFDVVARAPADTREFTLDEIARKYRLPHQDETPEPAGFASFFGSEAPDEEASGAECGGPPKLIAAS